jgi:uncharacterized protein YjhX (UPF0386 family)
LQIHRVPTFEREIGLHDGTVTAMVFEKEKGDRTLARDRGRPQRIRVAEGA